jgi:type I restriction enzyme S subunit
MVEDVTRDKKFVTPQIDYLTDAGKRLSRPCTKGTLTLVCSGTVGIPSFLGVDACIHDGFLALVGIKKNTVPDYLFHSFSRLREALDRSATHGGVFTNLTTSGVKEFVLPIPNEEEQHAIAEALSDADALIESLEKLIAKKRLIKQGTMQELLTGKKRLTNAKSTTAFVDTELGRLPADWPAKKLGDLFEITSSKRVFQNEWKKDGVPFFRARELAALDENGWVENEIFISRKLYDLYRDRFGVPRPDDFLVTAVGTLGKAYVVPPNTEFYFKDGNIIWFKTAGKIDPRYLYQLFQTELIMKQIKEGAAGTTVGTYTISNAAATRIPLPSPEEQGLISNVLCSMDSEIATIEKRLRKVRQTREGMMQELLTGRIRLI